MTPRVPNSTHTYAEARKSWVVPRRSLRVRARRNGLTCLVDVPDFPSFIKRRGVGGLKRFWKPVIVADAVEGGDMRRRPAASDEVPRTAFNLRYLPRGAFSAYYVAEEKPYPRMADYPANYVSRAAARQFVRLASRW